MKNLFLILLLFCFFSSCNDILDDPANARVGSPIEEELLKAHIWEISYFDSDQDGGATEFQNAFLEFNVNNTFDLINNDREIYTGQWALSSEKDLLVIRSDGKIPEPYKRIENEWVILNATDRNVRIQERDPKGTEEFELDAADDNDIPNVCNDLSELIADKKWRIQHLIVANSVKTADYEGYEFTFGPAASAVATTGNTELEGSWSAGIRCNKFNFGFNLHPRLSQISGLWQLSYFTESTIRLVMNEGELNWEMKLVTGPEGFDNLCQEAQSTLKVGSWNISKFVTGNDSYENDFTRYFFRFEKGGKLQVTQGEELFSGNWSLIDACRQMPITFEGNEDLEKLNGNWQVALISNELVKLSSDEENNKKEIHFTRDPESLNLCESLDEMYEDNLTWHITSYVVNNEILTKKLEGISIQMSEDNTLTINEGNKKINGTWELKDDCKIIDIKAEASDTNSETINSIAREWHISQATNEKITLVHETEESSIEMQLTLR